MAAATPTANEVLSAVIGVIEGIDPVVGTVPEAENWLDSDQELIEDHQDPDTGLAVIFLVSVSDGPDVEGPAPGQRWAQHFVRIRMLHVEMSDPDWARDAQEAADIVRDALDGNPAVFAIGGKRQVNLPETAVLAAAPRKVTTPEGNQFLEAIITLQVEGRRF